MHLEHAGHTESPTTLYYGKLHTTTQPVPTCYPRLFYITTLQHRLPHPAVRVIIPRHLLPESITNNVSLINTNKLAAVTMIAMHTVATNFNY